ncbi:unnamed protein product [Sphagnum troendelagicum]|uniref:Uncharacterized protein n=1 Tax=Sphagnum troendelagicum TaxID=128251 RepID=A0ABP0UUV1_9BRYO
MKSPPSSGSRPPRFMAPVASSSHELQLRIPSPQFDVDDPHAEVLILLQAVVVEANASSRISSRIGEITGTAEGGNAFQGEETVKVE